MEQELSATPAIPPDSLIRHHLFDGLAGNPPGALLFLLAARELNATHHYSDLGKALVHAENLPKGSELYMPQFAQSQLFGLAGSGYFRAVDTCDTVRVTSAFLPYKHILATTLLDMEIDFPETPLTDLLGTNTFRAGQAGTPSLSLALYRMLLSRPDQTIPRTLTVEDFAGQALLCANRQRAYSRITRMKAFGIIVEADTASVRLHADLLPLVAELLRRMDILQAYAESPAAQQAAAERAEDILTDPAAIHTALRKVIKQTRRKRHQTPPKKQYQKYKKTVTPTPIDSVAEVLPVKPGAYPSSWLTDAVCNDADPDLFILDSTPAVNMQKTKKAQEFCEDCPVRAPCLKRALQADDHLSIAALTPDERSALTAAQRERLLKEIIIPHAVIKSRPV